MQIFEYLHRTNIDHQATILITFRNRFTEMIKHI